MENSTKQIRPLLKQRFHLRSIYAYKECLIRRPKHILNLDCSNICSRLNKKTRFKLLKAVRLLKPVKKINLNRFVVFFFENCEDVLLSILKSASKVSAIAFETSGTLHELSNNAAAKWLKRLANLRSLVYECYIHREKLYFSSQQSKDPLRYLKWCPKIEALDIAISGHYGEFLKIFKFHKYPTSLKYLSLNGLLDDQEDRNFVIPFHRFKDLQSIYLRFDQTMCHNLVIRNLEALSSLPNLQEVILNLEGNLFPAIHPILRKLSQRKVFKKLALICIDHCPDEKALQILRDFDQLTHFKISAFVEESSEVRKITQCFEHMKNMEYLNVKITNRYNTNAGYELQIMLQNINHFDSLRFLTIGLNDNSNHFILPSFVPHLRHILTKAIPLESLSIRCDRLNPTQTLADLADVFQDCSHPLQKLDLYFGRIYCPEKKAQESVVRLLQSLKDLQVFSLDGHEINSKNYFAKMAAAFHQLKSLRELTFEGIDREALDSLVFQNLLSKRGLSSLICKVPDTYRDDLKSIARKNPFLERCELDADEDGFDRLEEMYKWDFPKWLGLSVNKPDSLSRDSQSDYRSPGRRSLSSRSPSPPGFRSPRYRSDDLSEDDQSDYRTLENQSPRLFGESPSGYSFD